MSDPVAMRVREELNQERLLQFFYENAVLRRPWLGPVMPKAHDMEREFTILSALHPVFPTAPKPLVFSADEAIMAARFCDGKEVRHCFRYRQRNFTR